MKKIFFCLICFFPMLFFLGCHEPVFADIRCEVVPTPATVTGNVNSISRYTFDGEEYLITQNGKSVFYKKTNVERTGTASAWTTRENKTFKGTAYNYLGANYDGESIIKLAVDDTYIYIITAVVKVNHDEGKAVVNGAKLYYTDSLDGDTWEHIDIEVSVSNPDTSKAGLMGTIFCTNSISKDGRKAFFRNGSDLYALNGASAPSAVDKSSQNIIGVEDKSTATVNSAVWFNDNVIFTTTIASATNETKDSPATMMYYYGSVKKDDKKTENGIYYSVNGVDSNFVNLSVDVISCIALTSDYLLFGQGESSSSNLSGGGIYKVAIGDGGVPGDSTVSFTSNADKQLTTSYQIVTLLVEDPSKPEMENIMYASTNFKSSGSSISVSFDNLGLWAYYPTRGNWNRE